MFFIGGGALFAVVSTLNAQLLWGTKSVLVNAYLSSLLFRDMGVSNLLILLGWLVVGAVLFVFR